MNYCNTCVFHKLAQDQQHCCILNNQIINPSTGYCSKHESVVLTCDICGGEAYKINSEFFIPEGQDKAKFVCGNCKQKVLACGLCQSADQCEFNTNPDPMPHVVQQQVRQGNMVMQTQIKNPERIKRFCTDCRCYIDGECMKNYGIGCINKLY